ncbi:beta-phosphoglucomutase [Paenilisteria rocourtiae]|uniref:Beta-phosphoglucomutase n=1 Tax=Listeria rocourtiae TaxID=647910 RepID=A0A4R6ZG78_9LIST|nr:beta-phosphoglucomutase [Listeria rocourtiae]EUJ52310.1 beta-phosphoglucomutase [Listeria rocourtiae FSL F6-920]MBC1605782.1 beta-phosphoglucomutase [Listeria rocourtiae]TDR51052.1 beta-phosphoglucomutase [Listeria rocourtiae]
MKQLEAVIFDLDGVITDSAHFHYLAWKQLAADVDIEIDEAFNETLKGISRMDSLDLILAKGGRENDFTLEQKEELAAKKNAHYVELLKDLSPADILPGIESLLEAIRSAGLKIALASVSKNAPMVLSALGLTANFDYLADAAKITRSKPDPEIFLVAAAGLDVEPANAVGIEDAQAGVEAIKSAGMKAIGVGTGLVGTDELVSDTSKLSLALIQKVFQM